MSASLRQFRGTAEGSYAQLVSELPFGKEIAHVVYVHAESLKNSQNELSAFVDRVRKQAAAGPDFNVIKFAPTAHRISFLAYPSFFDEPHPSLHASITVDFMTGKVRRHDYRNSDNPPILHRKETLLEDSHPLAALWRELTEAEEREGLYRNPRVIGFRRNWEALLAERGLSYEGHRIIRTEVFQCLQAPEKAHPEVQVERHKTAIVRYDLSKPIQSLVSHGLLLEDTTLLDYGCGRGDDVRYLSEMGYSVSAWDPVHFPEGRKEPARIVNLGFVLNVIEDPVERMQVLQDAFRLSQSLLVVSTLIATSSTAHIGRPYRDGVLTSRNTFQKYFRQDELERYIEDVLDTPAVAVGPGIFYVFRSPEDQQQFLSNRTRRAVNWLEIGRGMRPAREHGTGPRREGIRPRRPDVYESNKELLDAFWSRMLELGRTPLGEEFHRYDELLAAVGSAGRARGLFVRKFGEETLSKAFDLRRNDLLVYFALSNFRRRVPFKHLPAGLRKDIKTFLGGYKQAVESGLAMLFSAGRPDVIAKLCDETPFGHLDHQALYIHSGLSRELHPILRIYVGCAEILHGDLRNVDIIKIHKRSGKVSLLKVDEFDAKPLPELQERIKVNLRSRTIEIFDHRSPERQELLYFKERYVGKEHPRRGSWEAFSEWLRSLGLDLEAGYGPTKQELLSFLQRRGITVDLEPQIPPEPVEEVRS